MSSTTTPRRAILAVTGLAASLTAAAFALGPGAANSATIDQMAAQGDITAGSVACAGPFAAGPKDIVSASGSAFTTNALGVPVGVAVDWQLRRGDPGTDFFTDADVIQTAHTDFFSTSVQSGSKFVPGDFWVCVSSPDATSRAHYKMFLGNGLPA
ncbi:hypothetical protein [Actinomadura sp. DC4]|uniref:hypothetical protein n=1 Tax=Actinomadura sp. DC4 TaxID=3055069 RepID=UPI0025B0DD8D|nr:hypothetical protein [Actinomadura sp. DC4]MDN3352016.1 hypothetical protein [Actinomadura sp. DC4]